MKLFIDWVERGFVPDWLIRRIIRHVLADLVEAESEASVEVEGDMVQDFISELRNSPLVGRAEIDDLVGKELPLDFYRLVLGPALKFSGCYWPEGVLDIAEAEVESLKLCWRNAGVEDGMDILDFGCGWGSLTLALAEQFPNSQITAVSHSENHVDFIKNECSKRGLTNVGLKNIEVVRSGIKKFTTQKKYDRIFSIEALVHQTNLEKFMERFASWLKPEGKLFVQQFCHRDKAYHLKSDGEYDWMDRYFINAGIMPSDSLLLYFQRNLVIDHHWRKEGTNYAKSVEAWLKNIENNKAQVLDILRVKYGKEAEQWYHRWRVFFLTFSELFSFHRGNDWIMSYYLFSLRNAQGHATE